MTRRGWGLYHLSHGRLECADSDEPLQPTARVPLALITAPSHPNHVQLSCSSTCPDGCPRPLISPTLKAFLTHVSLLLQASNCPEQVIPYPSRPSPRRALFTSCPHYCLPPLSIPALLTLPARVRRKKNLLLPRWPRRQQVSPNLHCARVPTRHEGRTWALGGSTGPGGSKCDPRRWQSTTALPLGRMTCM